MKRICLTLLLCGISALGFAANSSLLNTETLNLAPFEHVHVSGSLMVNAFLGQPNPTAYVSGPGNVAQCVTAKVEGDTLFLSNSMISHHLGDCGTASVNLNMGNLTKLTTYGPATFMASNVTNYIQKIEAHGNSTIQLDGKNIDVGNIFVDGPSNIMISHMNASALTIDADNAQDIRLYGKVNLVALHYDGSGNLIIPSSKSQIDTIYLSGDGNMQLFGEFAVRQIVYEGSGRLQMYWIDSPQLSVLARGHGTIQLAGVTQVFHTNLYDRIHLDARYLRARMAFIETHNDSDANVWVSNTLFTYAWDASNVYYYTKPGFLTTNNQTSGSVLAMHDIPKALVQFQPSFWDN